MLRRKHTYITVEFTASATAGLKEGEQKKLPSHIAIKLIESGSAIQVSDEVTEGAENEQLKQKRTQKK